MKTNVHLNKTIFFALFVVMLSTKAYSQDAVPQTVPKAIANVANEAKTPTIPKSIRKKFRLGEILFAEIAKYDNSKVIIMNPEGIKQLDGVASIVFKLNKGRSIGLCDYVLEDSKGRQYPSVALKIDDGVFDGSVWEKDGEHKYSLLFFINYQPDNSKQSYKLKYVLLKDIKDEHDLELINIGNENFTKPSVIDETVEIAAPPSNPTTPTPAPETVKPPTENKDQQKNPPPTATPATPAAPVTPSHTTENGAPAKANLPATGPPPAPSPANGK